VKLLSCNVAKFKERPKAAHNLHGDITLNRRNVYLSFA
jgi:hypothetical protein